MTSEDVEVVREVREGVIAANEGRITIALETKLDEALELEGLARELVNRVNTMRREANLYVSDRIDLTLETTPRVQEAFNRHSDYVKNEILAIDVHFAKANGEQSDLNGEATIISMKKRV